MGGDRVCEDVVGGTPQGGGGSRDVVPLRLCVHDLVTDPGQLDVDAVTRHVDRDDLPVQGVLVEGALAYTDGRGLAPDRRPDGLWAEPVFGKSNLIYTLVKADGMVRIDLDTSGLTDGEWVQVILF